MDKNYGSDNSQNENLIPENKNKINFETKDTIDIVPVENKKDKNIGIVIIVIIITIACGIAYFITHNDNNSAADNESTESFFSDESFKYENNADSTENISYETTAAANNTVSDAKPDNKVESTSKPYNSTIPAQPSYDKSACETSIRAYFNRYFYYEGMLNNEYSEMAFDGDNFEMITDINGTEISILKIDGKLYFKRTALKQYAQLTDAVMQTLGLSIDKINFDSEDTNYEAMKECLTEIKPVTVDGKDGVCFRYDRNNNFFKFYFIDNKLVKIETGKANEIKSTFVISVFIPSIPGDMLSLKGYEETGFMSLFADYM